MINTQSSVYDAYPVSPNDTVDLVKGKTKAIYIGDVTLANVSVIMQGGQTVTFTNLAPGVIHQIAAKRIMATGTTSTNILALY